jgi:hypothetical protein
LHYFVQPLEFCLTDFPAFIISGARVFVHATPVDDQRKLAPSVSIADEIKNFAFCFGVARSGGSIACAPVLIPLPGGQWFERRKSKADK